MLKSTTSRPHQWFWHSSMLIIMLFCFGWTKAIDLQFHDTYLVIAALHIGILCSIYLSLIGYAYWLLRKAPLVNWMTLAHVLSTITFAIGLWLLCIMNGNKYFSFDDFYQSTFAFVVTAFLVIQAIFLLNVILSLLKNKR